MRGLIVVWLLVAACAERPAGTSSVASAAASSSIPPAVTASAAPLPKAEKLDAASARASLRCGKASGPCEVLAEFKECVPFPAVTASGDGRWMGIGYRVKGGAVTEEIALLRRRAVPASEVGAGALPALVAIDAILDDRPGEKRNAEHAVRAFARGDVPLPTNTAIRYVKERTQWNEAPVLAAEEQQLYVATSGGAHLCARSNQRVVLVQRDKGAAHPGDGAYAIVWPVSW